MDIELLMSRQVKKITKAASQSLYIVGKLRKYLNRNTTATLIHAYVTSRLDYCNSLLYALPIYQLENLQRIQNSAARLIFKRHPRDHISPVLKELHWLPIKFRIQYKLLLITFKVLKFETPAYLHELLIPQPDRHFDLRSRRRHQLMVPRAATSYGNRAFSVAAPTLWNRLPEHVKNSINETQFKSRLKTHLFALAY